jgi:putative acetyltransferase
MSPIVIRDERPADHASVYDLQAAAFGQRGEADLVVALRRDAEPQLSLVAERAGRVIGHVFVAPVQIGRGPEAPEFGGLAPIGVWPEFQRSGAGSALIRAGLARCPALGWHAVFLVGNPAYYRRFGFEQVAARGFHYKHPHFNPALQAIELTPGALAHLTGEVVYHPAFDDTGTA